MKTKILVILFFVLPFVFASCGGDAKEGQTTATTSETSSESSDDDATDEDYDETTGLGDYTAENFNPEGFDADLAKLGKSISETKCFSCHKITDEMLVGPGWKGVTERRTLHWLMNFITNPDPMIDKDPAVQAQLEECLVRMPNQNIDDKNAKGIVEYMRQIDGAK